MQTDYPFGPEQTRKSVGKSLPAERSCWIWCGGRHGCDTGRWPSSGQTWAGLCGSCSFIGGRPLTPPAPLPQQGRGVLGVAASGRNGLNSH